MMNTTAIIFDTASKRYMDENGFLHVSISHISKETVNEYLGNEIPGYEEFGLEPEKIYYGYRSGQALSDGAMTFNGLPILWDHHIEHADTPQKEYRIGSLGTDAQFNAPYLDNSLIFTDSKAIQAIESGQKVELSAAYLFEPTFEPGIFDDQPYDFIMTNIRGNHVALVDKGRAGPDVIVADSKSRWRGIHMKLGQGIKKILSAMDAEPDIKTTDEENISVDEDKDAKIKTFIQTYFATATPEQLEEITEALKSLAYSEVTGDEDVPEDTSSSEKTEDEDTELPETDEESDSKVSDEDETSSKEPKGITAMDAALVVKAAEDRAFNKVRSIYKAVQDVKHIACFHDPLAFDSAESIYKQALKLAGIEPSKHPKAAWKSLCETYSPVPRHQTMVMDANKFTGPFTHLNKIRIAA